MNEQNGLGQNLQNGIGGDGNVGNVVPTTMGVSNGQGSAIEPLPIPNAIQPVSEPVQQVSQGQKSQGMGSMQVNAAPQVNVAPVQNGIGTETTGQPMVASPQVIQNGSVVGITETQPQVEELIIQASPQPQVIQPQILRANVQEQVVPPTVLPPSSRMESQDITDIVANNVPLNPIGNEMMQEPVVNQEVSNGQSQTMEQIYSPQPQEGMISPGIPLGPGTDATQVGFIPSSSELPKKKNKPLIIGIVLGVVIVLGLLGYFVVYPFIVRTFLSDPINVYEMSINQFYKGISAKTNEIVHSKAIYDINLSVESNLENISNFSGYSYGVNLGIDPDKELLQVGYTITNLSNDNEYSYFDYIKGGKEYLKYSNNRGYIYNGTVDLNSDDNIFENYKKLMNRASSVNNEDIDYLMNKASELTRGSIRKDKLSKEDTTININDETIKVINNKYEVDGNIIKEMIDYIIDGLKNDSKAMNILTNLLGYDSEQDVRDYLDDTKSMFDIEGDVTYTFNIYTYGNKNDIIGFGLLVSDQSIEVQCYNKDNYFELHGKTSYDNEITGKLDEQMLDVVGVTANDRTDVSFKLNGTEVLSLVITEWTDTNVELSYSLKYDEYRINGKMTSNYDINDERLKFKFTGEANTGNEYIKIILNANEDWTSDVANINTDNAVTLSDAEVEAIENEFRNSLMDTPIGTLFRTINGDYSDGISTYYDNQNNGLNNDYSNVDMSSNANSNEDTVNSV